MRGLRMQLHWHENPQYRFAAEPNLAGNPTLQRNVARLADYGWTRPSGFCRPDGWRGRACNERAESHVHPTARGHVGGYIRARLAGVARRHAPARCRPNVVTKLSALGTFIHKNDPDHIAAIVRETVEIFGPARCMFGSNFPVEKLWTKYSDLVAPTATRLRRWERRRAAPSSMIPQQSISARLTGTCDPNAGRDSMALENEVSGRGDLSLSRASWCSDAIAAALPGAGAGLSRCLGEPGRSWSIPATAPTRSWRRSGCAGCNAKRP